MTSNEESLRSHFTARFLTLLTGAPRRLRRDIPLVALHDRRKRCHKHHKDAYDRTGEEAIQEIGEHSVQRAAEYKNVIGQIEVHKKLSQSCFPRFVYVKSVFKYITPDDARFAYKFLRPLSRFSIRPRRLCQGKRISRDFFESCRLLPESVSIHEANTCDDESCVCSRPFIFTCESPVPVSTSRWRRWTILFISKVLQKQCSHLSTPWCPCIFKTTITPL